MKTYFAILLLVLLLCFWKHIAAFLLDIHADYRTWKVLSMDSMERRSFWEECI